MILKLLRKVVHQPSGDKEEVKTETFFYDGFDRITVSSAFRKDMEPAFGGILLECYTEETSERVLCVCLLRKDEFIRKIYIDYAYDVYLMSNEGKTIERIN